MPDLVGTTIGQYQIVSRLGRGGTATVYKGYQTTLGRFVAVKVLEPSVADDELFLSRFQREARAVAVLRHPNIVQIYDFGNVDEMYYMVMEYIDGQSLRERLKSAASQGVFLPTQEVLAIVQAIASALDYAHKRGIVHRDVKPGNILLSSEGQPVLGDFGIAQMVETNRRTLTGLVGTPFYMSPEQGQGLEVDRRTDVYSLGIVTYEMLTHQIPFSAETPFGIVTQHVNRPLPSLTKIRPDLPAAVQQVLTKATAKLRGQRYDRAVDLADQLRDALETLPAAPSAALQAAQKCGHCGTQLESGQRFCPRCGTPVKLIGPEPPTVPQRKPSPAPPENLMPAGIRSSADAAGSGPVPGEPSKTRTPNPPTGTSAPKPPEAVIPLSGTASRATRRRRTIPWALIAGAIAGLILVVAAATVLLESLNRDDDAGQATAVAATAATSQTVVAADRTTAPVTEASTPGLSQEPTRPAVAAALTLTVSLSTPAANTTRALTAAAPASPASTARKLPARQPSATPRQQPDPSAKRTVTLATQQALTATRQSPVTPGGTRAPVLTIYIGIPTGTLTITTTEAAIQRRATPARRPSKGMILFRSTRNGQVGTYMMNADGSSQLSLSDSKIYEAAADRETLTPDGKERLRVLDNSGNYDIYMGPADEHKPPMAITSHAAADYDPAWSPTGDKIAFVSLRNDGKDAVFVMTPDGRNDYQLTFDRGFLDKHPTWSPDASQIAFGSNRDGNRQIYVMNADGSGKRNISNNSYEDYDPVWLKY